MVQRLHTSLLVIFLGLAVIAGLFFIPPTNAAGEPISLICPNKQTTFLSGGGAAPGESLIAYLSARPVGGGSARPDGSWRIPLAVNERPGAYPVEVRVRSTRALVASFTCYVDMPTATPLPGQPGPESSTSTPAIAPTTLTTLPSPTPDEGTTASPQATISPTATATRSPTKTATSPTPGTATPTPTATAVGESDVEVVISDVFCHDTYDDSEYIELRNDGLEEMNLLGWKVVNASRSNVSYTFPSYTMERGPDVYVTLYSWVGTDRADFAELYWNRTDQLWFVGDQAKLYDADGRLVDAYTVPANNCGG